MSRVYIEYCPKIDGECIREKCVAHTGKALCQFDHNFPGDFDDWIATIKPYCKHYDIYLAVEACKEDQKSE